MKKEFRSSGVAGVQEDETEEECRYYLILGDDLGYGDCTALEPVLEEVSGLLVGYAKAVARNQYKILRGDFT